MPKTFAALRDKTDIKKKIEEPAEKVKSAGVDSPLPSDEDQLDVGDENNRNVDGSAEDMVTKAIKPIYKKRKDGTYSLNTEAALQEDQELIENVLDNLKKIVTRSQAGTVKFKDGTSSKVDIVTASALLSVYGAINKNNQVKMAQILARDKSGLIKMANFALKQGKVGGLQGPSSKPIRVV